MDQPTDPLKGLVQVGEFPAELQVKIQEEFRCHPFEATFQDEALRFKVEGIITRSNYVITEEMIRSLPSLRIIATSGVGYDGIPLEVARERNVVVTNTPGVLDAAVCELAVGILLALLRKIPEADRFLRDGRWHSETFPLTTSLAGKTVGIIGLGRIGKGIANRLTPFEVRLAYHGTKQATSPHQHFDRLEDLAAAADILFVCCRGGESTKDIINSDVLEALGPEGFLINMARGSVVDEAALLHALTSRGVKGAGLDVYKDEPKIDPAFHDLPNTVLTPHVGSATKETRAAMLRLTLDNLHAVLAGRAALTPVV